MENFKDLADLAYLREEEDEGDKVKNFVELLLHFRFGNDKFCTVIFDAILALSKDPRNFSSFKKYFVETGSDVIDDIQGMLDKLLFYSELYGKKILKKINPAGHRYGSTDGDIIEIIMYEDQAILAAFGGDIGSILQYYLDQVKLALSRELESYIPEHPHLKSGLQMDADYLDGNVINGELVIPPENR